MWRKILASKILRRNDIVEQVRIEDKGNKFIVDYRTGNSDNFLLKYEYSPKYKRNNLFKITENDNIHIDIPVKRMYSEIMEDEADDKSAYHYVMDREMFNNATMLEKRIAFHRFLQKLYDHIDDHDYYPYHQRMIDIGMMRNDKPARYIHNSMFYTYPSGMNIVKPWRRSLEHYLPLYRKPSEKEIYLTLNECCYKKEKVPLETAEVRRRALYKYHKSVAYNPVSFMAILKSFKTKDSIIDLHPDFGHKAIACAFMGIKYICPRTEIFQSALDKGLADDFGLVHEWLDNQEAHTLVSDNNYYYLDMDGVSKYVDKCKHLISYCKNEERFNGAEKYNPTKIYPIMKSRIKAPGFILYW